MKKRIFIMLCSAFVLSLGMFANVKSASAESGAGFNYVWDGGGGFIKITSTKKLVGKFPKEYLDSYVLDGEVDNNLGWISHEVKDNQVYVYVNFSYNTYHRFYGLTTHYEFGFYYN
ncbi:hypothetical protein G3M81_19775 [Bacillus paralicheniformis]|uniref:hypothetical protein n=1 Tax=Bacillus paralicheniformis TaxID=1648923 RepID=UPI0013EF08E6|nr:hypothetical protein [Bacillus paralicheniformis]QII50830.1 hypothetical protein G3M81_19775 [Bacillus paralicheniformis]